MLSYQNAISNGIPNNAHTKTHVSTNDAFAPQPTRRPRARKRPNSKHTTLAMNDSPL